MTPAVALGRQGAELARILTIHHLHDRLEDYRAARAILWADLRQRAARGAGGSLSLTDSADLLAGLYLLDRAEAGDPAARWTLAHARHLSGPRASCPGCGR